MGPGQAQRAVFHFGRDAEVVLPFEDRIIRVRAGALRSAYKALGESTATLGKQAAK